MYEPRVHPLRQWWSLQVSCQLPGELIYRPLSCHPEGRGVRARRYFDKGPRWLRNWFTNLHLGTTALCSSRLRCAVHVPAGLHIHSTCSGEPLQMYGTCSGGLHHMVHAPAGLRVYGHALASLHIYGTCSSGAARIWYVFQRGSTYVYVFQRCSTLQ